MTTVHTVTVPVWEYNDEGYYRGEGEETAAICETKEAAERWIATNGWSKIEYAMSDPGEYGYDFSTRYGAKFEDYQLTWDAESRKKAVADLCRIREVQVLT